MKKKGNFLMMVLVLCVAFPFFSCGNPKASGSETISVSEAAAADSAAFEGGGLRFAVVSDSDMTVAVCGVSRDIDKSYAGEFVVPACIDCNGKKYTVISLGEKVFSDFTEMTSVSLPETLQSIGGSAFAYCSSLASVKMGSSVTLIGDYAFERCFQLASVAIPASVTSIGKEAFAYCSGLKEITSLAVAPPAISYYTFSGVSKTNTVLKVPKESVAAYKAADLWKNFANIKGI